MKLTAFKTRRRLVVLIVTLTVISALAATAYVLRSRLAGAPLVGRWFQQAAGPQQMASWTCPMHPHVREHGPGRCPECGMDLVPVTSAEAAATNTAPEGR
jgi:hypothetical protein